MEVYIQIVTTGVYLWHCNYSSISSQKRSDDQIFLLQLCQTLVSMQLRERNVL